MRRRGVLGPKTIAAHCVHVDDSEMDTLLESGTNVVHNPRSNMNNAVGVARIPEMLARGITVGIGNDGFSNSMYAEMKAAYMVHKLAAKDPRVMSAIDVLKMANANNAMIAGCFFGRPLGVLAPGAYADIVFLDYLAPTPLSEENYPWHVMFGIDGAHVDTTIVGGEVLMRGRQVLSLDADAIHAEAREQASQLWESIQTSG